VDDDSVCEPAAADEAEDAVAFSEVASRPSGGDDRACDLEPRDVLGRSWRGRVCARALCEIRRVERGEAHGDEKFRASRRGVRTLLEAHHFTAPGAGVDDCPHVGSFSDRQLSGAGSIAALGGARCYSCTGIGVPSLGSRIGFIEIGQTRW
jgi:hypothetical protein